MKLIITSKPNVQYAINDSLLNIESDGICNLFRFYKFNNDNYSFPSYPQYKYDNDFDFFYPMYNHGGNKITKGKEFKFHEHTCNDFLKYSEICFFLEPCHTNFAQLIYF